MTLKATDIGVDKDFLLVNTCSWKSPLMAIPTLLLGSVAVKGLGLRAEHPPHQPWHCHPMLEDFHSITSKRPLPPTQPTSFLPPPPDRFPIASLIAAMPRK